MSAAPLAPSTRTARAFAVLGVHTGEERGAWLMTANSFFMGCSTVFFETAVSAAFLARFPASYLPWIYIAAAGVNTVTGSVYANVQRHVSFARLMKGTLWFLLAMALTLRAGFALSGVAWVAFAGLVSYRVLSSLTDLEYWAVASRIYDVRQAKRLFGLIGTGEVVARIVGAFSIPILVGVGGVSNLILLSAGALALCVVLVGAVLRPVAGIHDRPKAGASETKDAKEARAGIREIAASPYLAMVIGVAILATFGKYFVDFSFLQQMSTLPKGEAQIATFIGIFNGVAQTLSLATRLFVSRPLLNRFGIRLGVMVLPVMHALCAAATVVCGLLGASPVVVFWLIVANQGIYDTFKHPIDNASFKVLYQPLKAAQRLAAQIAVEVIFSPVVVGVAGAVMLLFSAGMTYDPVKFSAVLLVNFVAWALFARAAGKGYQRKLVDNLRARIDGNVALPFDDATTLSVLRSRLDSAVPAEVCVALDLLEKAAAPDLIEVLVARSTHASEHVRRYAVERLVELRPAALTGGLRAQITRDPAASVRRAASRAAAASAGAKALDAIGPYLRDPDAMVRRAAVAVLFGMTGDATAERAAIETVESFAASANVDDRVIGARLAGEHGVEAVVRRLLGDPSFTVRRAALDGAGRLRSATMTDELMTQLVHPQLGQAAAAALAARGDAVLATLEARVRVDTDRLLVRRLVEVYRLVGTPAAIAVLRANLAFPDAVIRGSVLAALDALGYVAGDDDRDAVRTLITEEVREATWTLGALRDLEVTPALADLRAALEADVVAAGERVFDLLAFSHERIAVQRVAANISLGTKEKRAYAHEVLDLMLEPSERELVSPLLDDAPSAERLRRLSERFPQPTLGTDAQLRALIARSDRWSRSFPRALAIRAAVARGIAEGASAWLTSTVPLVHQTAVWAMSGTAATKDRPSMLLIEKVIMLKTVPMFARADDELLAEMAAIFEEVEYRAGDLIVAKGEAGESMYIVVSGSVRVFDGDTDLSVLREKEIFGELALLDPQPRSASVVAIEDARLFKLDGETFTQLMAGHVEIVRGVLHVLCERLRKTSASI